ncbi:MAG: nucleoside recognition domain-containing protein [Oscillospiraceae bacterium]|nr:nucleoside recognition domain-containing protein [Oscillospiraceae bacterium]MDD4545990.1 nucleoside recognition domain-containing protein [Oscillospiraceae bacterium]
MLNKIWAGIMLVSIAAGAVTGNLDNVTKALLGGGGEAISLCLTLGGAMCLWGGMMRIADKGGLTLCMSKMMSPLMRLLFPGLDPSGEACRAILMNMAANFLGLGNAATPLGLSAMKSLSKANPHPGTASSHMITFVVLNTASIQFLPTTVATMRLKYGAESPLNILPAVWATSFGAAVVAVFLSRLFSIKRSNCHPRLKPANRKVRT